MAARAGPPIQLFGVTQVDRMDAEGFAPCFHTRLHMFFLVLLNKAAPSARLCRAWGTEECASATPLFRQPLAAAQPPFCRTTQGSENKRTKAA